MPAAQQANNAIKKTPVAPNPAAKAPVAEALKPEQLAQVQKTSGYAAQQELVKPKGAAKPDATPKATKGTHAASGPAVNLGIPGQAGLAQGGLPETLQNLPSGKKVAHGTDPGNFYCEHMFFSTQTAAAKAGSSVVDNAEGESLTGFLHLPGDREATADLSETYTRKDSKKDAQAVVGSALRGWIDTAQAKVPTGPIKMLLTGYANWGSVVNNPTGGFVSAKKNLDAVMAQGYGAKLLTPSGKMVEQSAPDATGGGQVYHIWSYKIATESGEREVLLRGQVFPVADSAIDRGPHSVQQVMADFAPHGVLSLGVAVGHDDFLAEHHADDGGLDRGHKKHEDGTAPRKNLPDNYALGRGIVEGQAADKA